MEELEELKQLLIAQMPDEASHQYEVVVRRANFMLPRLGLLAENFSQYAREFLVGLLPLLDFV